MVAFLGTTFVLLLIVLSFYRVFHINSYKLDNLCASIPDYDLYYHSAIEVPSYFNAQQSPSFAKDQVEQMIFYSTVFSALLTNNFLKTRLINPNNMHFVCLAANAAAKAIEDQQGSIREQYNFACAIVCLLAKKRAFKLNVEDYCSNKITEILESKLNILHIFDFKKNYYPEDLQVNNRNLDLIYANSKEISLKAANALNTKSTSQNKLDESLGYDSKKDIFSGKKSI